VGVDAGVGISEVHENGQGRPEAIVASSNGEDQLDRAGQEILGLLQRAATVAEKNSQHALGIAHKLSLELRASEDHIKKLEAELQYYKDRSGRAEDWLRQISAQIEVQFPAPIAATADPEAPRQNGFEAYAPKKPDRRRS
jgi:hypothetical protein